MRILAFLICLIVFNPCQAKFEDPRPPIYTIEQEQQFANQPELFAYFSELYVYKKSPEQIAKENDLSLDESLIFLKKLADIKIIKPLSDMKNLPNKVEFMVSGISRFRENGATLKKFYEMSINEYFVKIKEQLHNKDDATSTTGFWITDDQYDAYLKDLYEIDQKYVALSVENRRTDNKNAHRVSLFRTTIPNWEPSFFKKVKMDQKNSKDGPKNS